MDGTITKDTRLCMSLAARPSNIGTRFHNFLYRELGLDFVYKAFTTEDLPAAVAGIRALGIRGCGVSMPFKEDCLALVDEVDPSAAAIGSVNTIVNTGGVLRAFNTDYLAIRALLERVPPGTATVLGSGGMARAVVAALRDTGRTGTVVARNANAGQTLAAQYGFEHRTTIGTAPDLLVNATPVGMAGGPDATRLPVDSSIVDATAYVLDVVALPADTPLIRRATARGRPVVTGAEVIALQAAEQFELYTGVRPTDDQIRRASAFSRT